MTPIARRAGFAAIAAAAAFAFATPAQAGTQFCGGHLVADSVYQTVTSNGSSARVEFFLQLRNSRGQPVSYTLEVRHNGLHGRPDPHRVRSLAAWQSERISLGYTTVQNAAGTGAPSPAQVAQSIRITCS